MRDRQTIAAVPAATGSIDIPGVFRSEIVSARAILQVTCAARMADELRYQVQQRLKIALPDRPQVELASGLALACIGACRWLAMTEDVPAHVLTTGLTNVLKDLVAITDVSDHYAVVRLSGSATREVLAQAVPVDLHPSAFDVAALALTNVHHVPAILVRIDEAAFEVLLPRSYAQSFVDWLATATVRYRAA